MTSHAKHSHIIEISNPQQFREVISDTQSVILVDFYADWCGPCKRMSPLLHELSTEYAGRLKVVKINIDTQENSPLSEAFNISSLPSFVLIKNGKQVNFTTGMMDRQELINFLNS